VGRQRALHTENSGFVAATLQRHISTFRGYEKKAVGRQRNLGLMITMNENAQWQMIKDSVLFALSSGFSVSLFHFYYFHVSWLSDFIFYPKPLYKSLHQSFFYSFITILPSESGGTLHYSTILP
jgi:hypothetical protein